MNEILERVVRGLDIIEASFKVSQRSRHIDAPFPLDGDEARLWHKAQSSAYLYVLEMIPNVEELRKLLQTEENKV